MRGEDRKEKVREIITIKFPTKIIKNRGVENKKGKDLKVITLFK